MRQPIALRPDFDASGFVEWLVRARMRSRFGGFWRWRRSTRAAAAPRQPKWAAWPAVVRDWVVRFNAAGPEGLIDRKAPGQPSRLNEEHRAALAAMVEHGPDPCGARGGALADHRPVPMALGGIRDHRVEADAEPRTAGDGLSQVVGAPTPSRTGGGCR